MTDEPPMTGEPIGELLTRLFDEMGKRIDAFLSGSNPKPVSAAEMTDAQLRQAIFRIAADLIEHIGPPLMQAFGASAVDDPAFRHGLPGTVRMHTLLMFAQAHDSFALSTIGLQHSANASSLGPIRNVAETLAVTRWLLDDPDEKIRRGRGHALNREDIKKQKRLSEHLVKAAPDPSDTRLLATRLGARAKQAERDLRTFAAQEGVTIPVKPDREALFEQYLPDVGDYALFAFFSNAGAHPGLTCSSLFYGKPDTGAVDFDFQGRNDARAYWLAQGTLLHLNLCRLVAPVLGWQGWEAVNGTFQARFEPLAEEAERRFIRRWRQALKQSSGAPATPA